jgi:hypothetical protein
MIQPSRLLAFLLSLLLAFQPVLAHASHPEAAGLGPDLAASALIAHAALGCASGAVASGDCASGAVGGVAGEIVGTITEARIEAWLGETLSAAQNGTADIGAIYGEINRIQCGGKTRDIGKMGRSCRKTHGAPEPSILCACDRQRSFRLDVRGKTFRLS